jgi:integrase
MSDTVVALLQATPRTLHRDRVFPTFRFALQKQRLDAAAGISGWVLHDLRRTMRTGLAELGIADSVAEACLAHTQGGIQAVYNKHKYLAERAAALAAWERHLLDIVESQSAAAKI